MEYTSINLEQKFSLFQEKWKPKVIAELNDHQFKIVKLKGDFIWHSHEDTDKAFIVISGELKIDFRDGMVNVRKGELYIVPKGVEHKPSAEEDVELMLIEPKAVKNTGDEKKGDSVAENDVWI